MDLQSFIQRYEEERSKRQSASGGKRFIDISLTDGLANFHKDPWVDTAPPVNRVTAMFPEKRCRMLIIGAGWGGILWAIRMVESGVMKPDEIRIIDTAADFGGTWYWNRYPGLMCDIESYIYLPLLEETGYVPRDRYASGEEIRDYAGMLVQRWGLAKIAVFQTQAQKLVWDEESKGWDIELVQQLRGEPQQLLSIRSNFVVVSSGVSHWPTLPTFAVPGILDFKGPAFHTSRWDYTLTGGSPSDPSLSKLRDKRVAIIGTSSTAVQAIPHLAHWSKHLYVFQRTPSSVDSFDPRKTDTEWFYKNVATGPGWQRERALNMIQQYNTQEKNKPTTNLSDDEPSRTAAFVTLVGDAAKPNPDQEASVYINHLLSLDLPRQNRIRARVEQTVQDPKIAKKLQAWYPSWCRRPCFHEDYLSVFNLDSVTLVDTDGANVDRITADSLVVRDEAYPVDMIIFATGFRPRNEGSLAERSNMRIFGLNGMSMTDEWAKNGPSTLHGVIDHRFPNLFFPGPFQSISAPINTFSLDALGQHVAYILSEATKKAGQKGFAVAPTADAAKKWTEEVTLRALPMSVLPTCASGFANLERLWSNDPQNLQARWRSWGHGVEDFLSQVEVWRAEGSMQGIEVRI